MKKTIALLLSLLALPALAAPPAHVAAPPLLGAQGELLAARVLAAGYGTNGTSNASIPNPFTPPTNPWVIKGNLTVSSAGTPTDTTTVTVIGNTAQTANDNVDIMRWKTPTSTDSANSTGISIGGNLRFGYTGGTGLTWRGAGTINQNAAYLNSPDGYTMTFSTGSGLGDNNDAFNFRLGNTGPQLSLSRVGGTPIVTTTTNIQETGLASRFNFTNTTAGATNISEIRSSAADAAATVAVRISAGADLTTAGARILSLGDAAASAFVEKSYVDLNGDYWNTTTSADFGTTVGNSAVFLKPNATNVLRASINEGVAVFPGFGFALGMATITPKTAAYTALKTDSTVLADPNGAAGSFAITLPAASDINHKGQILIVKVVSTHATRVITVIRAGSDTIEGVTAGQTTTTFTTTANLASAVFQSDGTSKWYLIASNGTVN